MSVSDKNKVFEYYSQNGEWYSHFNIWNKIFFSNKYSNVHMYLKVLRKHIFKVVETLFGSVKSHAHLTKDFTRLGQWVEYG